MSAATELIFSLTFPHFTKTKAPPFISIYFITPILLCFYHSLLIYTYTAIVSFRWLYFISTSSVSVCISVSECVHSIDLYVRYIRVDETFSFHLVSFPMCALSNKRTRSSISKIFIVSFCAILKRENKKREMSQRNAIHATWLQRSLLFAFARTQTHTNERTVYNNNADAAFKKRIRLMIL